MQRFTVSMPLLTATSAFCLGRRRWSSPQRCHLHCICTFIYRKTALYKTLQSLTAVLWLVRAVSAVISSVTVVPRPPDAPAILTPELIFTTCCQCSHHHELVVQFSQLHSENTTISQTNLIATMCFMSSPSSMKSSIVLCYNINKLTYLLTYSFLAHLSLNWLYFHCANVILRLCHAANRRH